MTTRTITVRRRLKAPAEALYATLTDPERFAGVRGIRSVEVITEGPDGPASAGTVRRVNLPLDHRFGRIEFHLGFTIALREMDRAALSNAPIHTSKDR